MIATMANLVVFINALQSLHSKQHGKQKQRSCFHNVHHRLWLLEKCGGGLNARRRTKRTYTRDSKNA